MRSLCEIQEGYMDFMGYKTWFRIAGNDQSKKVPLLVLHGGPGSCHNYLTSLDGLTEYGRKVIYYDQIGCGKSSVPNGKIQWNEQIFLEELKQLRKFLKLDKVHILGQSWGGMLGMEYMEQEPEGVVSFVIASSPASMKRWQEETRELVKLLPKEDIKAIQTAEEKKNYDTQEYQKANEKFFMRHVCSLDPMPEQVAYSMNSHTECYEQMIGPSEFTITGNLKEWDIQKDLGKIQVPVLITSGTMDEATPFMMKEIQEKIPKSRWELLKGTHLVHWEQKEIYNPLIENFLEETERI